MVSRRFLSSAVLVAALFACVSANANAQSQKVPVVAPPDAAIPVYRIEPGNTVTVKYRYTPEYDYTTAVQPDGFMSLPIVGQVKVSGLTVEEAIEAIRTEAGKRLRDPEITLEVKEFQSPRFFVLGEVGKPGDFPIHGRIGVLEALALAGGLKSSAKHSQVVFVRRLDDHRAYRTVVNAKELAKNQETQDIDLQPGDLLFVPQNGISKVTSIVPLFSPLGSIALLLNVANN